MFSKRHTIKTAYTKDEVLAIIENYTDLYKKDSSDLPFEGRIESSGKFTLKPLYDYGPRNQFRPDIHVRVSNYEVELVFKLNPLFKSIMLLVLVMDIGVLAYVYFKMHIAQSLLLIPFMIGFLLVLGIQFKTKTDKGISIFEGLLTTKVTI